MHWIIAIACLSWLMGGRRKTGAELHESQCRPVPRDELIDLLHYHSNLAGCPVDFALLTAERESSMHNDRYNRAYRSGKYYAYEKLIRTHIQKNAGLKKWFEKSPWRDDPTAWGSYGVLQIHPHWVYQHLPAGEDHDIYMGDAGFTIPIQCGKFRKMWDRWGNCADARLRYLGWSSLEHYLDIYESVQLIAPGARDQDQKRAISAIEKKIPAALKAYRQHNGTSRFFAPGLKSEYLRLQGKRERTFK